MKQKKPNIDIPENVKVFVAKERKRREEAEEKKAENKRLRDKVSEVIEKNRLKDGLPYARVIWQWAEDMRKSETGRNLIELTHAPSVHNGIWFFTDHVEGGPWKGLVLTMDGIYVDSGGRFGSLIRKKARHPTDLVHLVFRTAVLKAVAKSIEDDSVWDCIMKKFEDLGSRDNKYAS